MRYEPEFLELLSSKARLSEVVGQKVHLQKKGREFVGLCPFHKEKSPSFFVSDQKATYHCFGCGASGNIFNFLTETFHYTFVEAVEEIARITHTPLPEPTYLSPEKAATKDQKDILLKIHEEVCVWFQQQLMSTKGAKAREYLNQRGIKDETIKKYRLGYAPSGNFLMETFVGRGYPHQKLIDSGLLVKGENGIFDRFRDRLMFPIFSPKGEVIAFGGRIFGEGQPKYLNSPETPLFHKKYTLYGANFLREALKEGRQIYVTEGYMDVIAVMQAGLGATVAPLGTALTEEQIMSVWKYCESPILCFDGDAAGINAAARAALRVLPILKAGHSLNFVLLPNGEDPDSLIRSGSVQVLKDLFSQPLSLFDMLWQHNVAGQNIKTPEQQAKVQKDFFALIEQIKDLSVCYSYKAAAKDRFFKYFRNFHFKKQAQASPSLKGIRTRFDVRKRQRMILFAILLNHPHIINEVEDNLVSLDIPENDYDFIRLRDEIFSWITNASTLDAQDLNHHLSKKGFEELLNSVLSQEIYQHASFAKPEASIEAAREGWQDVWFMLEGNVMLAQQREIMRKELLDSMDNEVWTRFQALQNQVVKN